MSIAFTGATTSTSNVCVEPSAASINIAAYCDDDGLVNPIVATGYTQKANNYAVGDGANTALLFALGFTGGTSVTFNSGTTTACVAMSAFSGVDTTTPFDVTPTFTAVNTGSGSTWTVIAPSITTVTDGCQIVYFICFDPQNVATTYNSTTPPTGYTQQALVEATNQFAAVAIVTADAIQSTHGATGTVSITVNLAAPQSGGWVVYTVALRPLQAPTITSQPSNASSVVQGTATFSVSATASAGSLTYQWKLNGVNVSGGSGGTSASYTTPALNIGDNGNSYTCVVTDSNGSSTTSAALLTTFWNVTGADSQGAVGQLANGESPDTTVRLLQNVQSVNAASGSTIVQQYTNSVYGGSTLWCAVSLKDVTGAGVTVADDINGSWTQLDVFDDSTNLQKTAHFYFPNSAPGRPTVTATYSLATTLRAIWIAEIVNAAAASLDGHTGQIQASPGSGTDAVTSGTATPSKQPVLVVALSMDNRAVSPVAPAAGTGFTDFGAGWNLASGNQARLEAQRVLATTAIAGTFTGTSGVASTTVVAIFDELGATGAAGSVVAATPQAAGAFVGAELATSSFGATPQAAGAFVGAEQAASSFAATPQASTSLVGAERAAATIAATPQAAGAFVGAEQATSSTAATPQAAMALVGAEQAASGVASTPQANVPMAGNLLEPAVLSSTPQAASALVGGTATGSAVAAAPQAGTGLVGAEQAASTVASTPQAATSLSGAEQAASAFAGAPQAAAAFAGAEQATASMASAPQAAGSIVGAEQATSVFVATPQAATAMAGAEQATSTVASTPQAVTALVGAEQAASAFAGAPQAAAAFTGAEQATASMASAPQAAGSIAGAEQATSAFAATPQAATAMAGAEQAASLFAAAPQAASTLVGAEQAASAMSAGPQAAVSAVGAEQATTVMAGTPQANAAFLSVGGAATTFSPTPQASTSLVGAEQASASTAATPQASTSLVGAEQATGAIASTPQANGGFVGAERATSSFASAPRADTGLVGGESAASSFVVTPQAAAAFLAAEVAAAVASMQPSATLNWLAASTAASVWNAQPSALANLAGAESVLVSVAMASTPTALAALAGAIKGAGGAFAATPQAGATFNSYDWIGKEGEASSASAFQGAGSTSQLPMFGGVGYTGRPFTVTIQTIVTGTSKKEK